MAKCNDRVKEGRSRVGLLLDDNQLEAIDAIADITDKSRSQIIQHLIEEGLQRREFYDEWRNYPEFVNYWIECMKARPKDAFFNQPISYEYKTQGGFIDRIATGYADMFDDDALRDIYDDSDEYYEIKECRNKIMEISKKYKEAFDRIEAEERKVLEELERKSKLLRKPELSTRKGKRS